MVDYDKSIQIQFLVVFRAQGIATDITVQCKDGEFKAHSVVLLASGLAERVKESRDKNLLDLRQFGF